MMPLKDVLVKLAADRKMASTRSYTENSLSQTELSAQEKLKIIKLNQDQRLDIIKRVMIHTLTHLFKQKPSEFFTNKYHYDWWSFPMYVPREWGWEERNYLCSINKAEAAVLLSDPEFFNAYLEGISLYLYALKSHGWNDYPVRYARMLHSLSLFIKTANEQDNKDNCQKLAILGRDAIQYAQETILPLYPEYVLLHTGFKNTAHELKLYELQEREQLKASL